MEDHRTAYEIVNDKLAECKKALAMEQELSKAYAIITIQDELNATNDSIIELLKVDNARLEERIVLLTAEIKTIKDMY